MSATAGREYPTERQWIERRREMDRRAWDAALAKRECIAAVAEWHPLTPDPMVAPAAVRITPARPWRWVDWLIVGAVLGAGCAMWGWVIWRGFERWTR